MKNRRSTPFLLALALATTLPFAAHAAPANDNLANATALSGALPVSLNDSNVDATLEQGETAPAGGTATVWYTWTAPSNGVYSAFTSHINNSDPINTVLGVYTGTNLASLALVGENDNQTLGAGANNGKLSFVGFNATASTTYLIAVGGKGNTNQTTGNFRVSVAARPANDDFATPLALPSTASNLVTGSTEGGSKEVGEPQLALSSFGRASVWFTFTPPTNGSYVLEIQPSSKLLDPLCGVYTGTSLTNLVRYTRAYNATGYKASWLADSATQYFLQLDGNGPARLGDYTVKIYPGVVVPPSVDTNRVQGVEIAIRVPNKDGKVVKLPAKKKLRLSGKVSAIKGISIGDVEYALSTNLNAAGTTYVSFPSVKKARKGRTAFFKTDLPTNLVGDVRVDVRASIPAVTNYSQDFTRKFQVKRIVPHSHVK